MRTLALTAAMLAAGCNTTLARSDLPWARAQQMVLVTTTDWNANHGTLRRFEGSPGEWRPIGPPVPVTIGRAGSAWGLGLHAIQPGVAKREGDGRAPAGVFRVGIAFGYAPTASTGLLYRPMSGSDYCVDVSGSPLYNRIVDAADVGRDAVAGSTEPMRRDIHANGDLRYKLGFVIEHNAAAVPDAGSCIFAHLWKAPGQATAGCTAMDEAAMRELLDWLRPEREPAFVLLPDDQYARLQRDWQLPALIDRP